MTPRLPPLPRLILANKHSINSWVHFEDRGYCVLGHDIAIRFHKRHLVQILNLLLSSVSRAGKVPFPWCQGHPSEFWHSSTGDLAQADLVSRLTCLSQSLPPYVMRYKNKSVQLFWPESAFAANVSLYWLRSFGFGGEDWRHQMIKGPPIM